MRFTKMQGLGNDYLYIYAPAPEDAAELSRRLSDRHFGPGADGLIFMGPSSRADFSILLQRAGEAALSPEGLAQSGRNIEVYRLNAKILTAALETLGLPYTGGKNAPYVWFRCPKGMRGWDFFDFLIDRARIVGTPGVGFGPCGEGWFRFSCFGTPTDTREAALRLTRLEL